MGHLGGEVGTLNWGGGKLGGSCMGHLGGEVGTLGGKLSLRPPPP